MWSFRGERDNTYVYHICRGYYYHFSYSTPSTIYFKCQSHGRGCRGRAVLYEDGLFHETRCHNHGRNYNRPEVSQLRQAILEATRSLPALSFRQVVERERRRFPLRVQSEVTVNSMRHSMWRVRMENYPPQRPQTMEELVAILNNDQYRFISQSQDGQDNLFASSVIDAEGNTHIILITGRMRAYLERCSWVFLDGHFASRPVSPPMAQIFNIATSWEHHAIYLGSVFMSSRTHVGYSAVFEGLLQLMPNLDPECISSDFETAMQSASIVRFPNAIIVGCFWHFARAVVKKAQKLGLGTWVLRSRRFRRHLRMCCCLALFPTNVAPQALFEIGIDILLTSGWFVYEKFYPLLRYLQNKWLDNPLRRETMSVYGSHHRTNNVVECLNRYMRSEVGAHHPNIYALLESLSRMEANAFAAINALENGRHPTRVQRTSALWNDQRLQLLGRTLEEQPFGLRHAIMMFLWYSSNTFRAAYNDLIGFEEY